MANMWRWLNNESSVSWRYREKKASWLLKASYHQWRIALASAIKHHQQRWRRRWRLARAVMANESNGNINGVIGCQCQNGNGNGGVI